MSATTEHVSETHGDTGKPITRDASFWGITLAQFFTVFNDNFYKAIVLYACVNFAKSSGSGDLQGVAQAVFSIPFLLLSGFCGFLSDKFSKRSIILTAKLAEIVIMAVGVIGFMTLNVPLMMGILFLMGVHSALFGPAKYGILPELFTERQLPKVNGLFQMSMFLSIIMGLAISGIVWSLLFPQFANTSQAKTGTDLAAVVATDAEVAAMPAEAGRELLQNAAAIDSGNLWIASVICVVLAVMGFLSALMIRKTPIAKPDMKFNSEDLILNRQTRSVLWNDKPLFYALLATSGFWATGGLVYPQAINAVAIKQLELPEYEAGFMAAGTGLGIALGCIFAMLLSKGNFNAKLVRLGVVGMFLGLILLAIPGETRNSILVTKYGMYALLIWIGVCAGLFSVPLQVYLQARAPKEHKGRIIGAMNLANWIGIFLSAGLYSLASYLRHLNELPENVVFCLGAVVLLPIVLLYRPKSERLADQISAVKPT